MPTIRIALANIRFPHTAEESVEIVLDAMEAAANGSAAIVCFPECIIPGYRVGLERPMVTGDWLNDAWSSVDAKAAELGICVILGTERFVAGGLRITARVTNADGTLAGFQDKVQLDPSEESTYSPGVSRRVFHHGDLTFGVVICHEGWRYPETVRWVACNGAQIVFHPHVEVIEHGPSLSPAHFADPANTFHEKAALCRAAENTCYFATVNCALLGASTTSAIIDPQGELIAHQPHGLEGILFGDIDLEKATGFLARRFKPITSDN
ncbi:MAG: carbon-nitrogen hydrolase family protein [Verrucomicrobiota bacterium]